MWKALLLISFLVLAGIIVLVNVNHNHSSEELTPPPLPPTFICTDKGCYSIDQPLGKGRYKTQAECQAACTKPQEVTLRTVNYNIFGRWSGLAGSEGQNERLAAIPAAIAAHPKMGKEVDVITVEEAWCPDAQIISGKAVCEGNDSRNLLIAAMTKHGWKYHTDVIDKPGAFIATKQTGGGAMIFSRWPIEATSGYVYKTCKGQDCSAAKGAVYLRITKTAPNGVSQAFNIIGTHLQAWSTAEGREARQGQLNEIKNDFVPAIGIKGNGTEPLLYQGDMNVDYVLYPEETDNMLKILQAKMPPTVPNSPLFTSNPSTNFLVGKDGAAEQDGCLDTYKAQLDGGNGAIPSKPSSACKNIPTTAASGKPLRPEFVKDGKLNVGPDCKAYCPCCPHEMLDYILYSTESQYLQPVSSNVEIVPLKSLTPLTYDWGWCDGAECLVTDKKSGRITGRDLADHYPMVANLTFRPKTTKFIPPDGCKTNSDCHPKLSLKGSCYCIGPGCTLNGTHVDGWKRGGKDKVNHNCQFRTSGEGVCFCRPGNQ